MLFMQRLLDDGDNVTVFDVDLFTKRWELIMSPAEIAKVSTQDNRSHIRQGMNVH